MTENERRMMDDTQHAQIAETLAAAEAVVANLKRLMATPAVRDPLLAALGETFGSRPFTAGEVIQVQEDQMMRAALFAQRPGALAAALQAKKISTSYALGRWLAGQVGRGISKVGRENGRTLWLCNKYPSHSQE